MSHIDQFQHLKIQLEAIQSATSNFSADYCIGRGGFGNVYKGELVHSRGKTMVALKRLNRALGQGDPEFWKEITTLSVYRHENIVSLLGYCDDHGEKILVYEYASKKSLDSYLASRDLTWVQRLKICIGAARGLAYLHTPVENQLRILHRDIKSSNILLDNNWNAKISDFGLSKLAPTNSKFTIMVSNPTGTLGYIDPLYQESGLLTKESDVYSFGVVLFEVLCGRLCFSNQDLPHLVGMVKQYHKQNKISELVFSNIKDQIKQSSLELFADIAYQCLKRKREKRPPMTEIVRTLKRALDIQEKAAVEEAKILKVTVLRTTDVKSENALDASNHYFVVSLKRKAGFSKSGWNEESTLYVKRTKAFNFLCISLYKIVSLKKHLYLGNAILFLRNITPEIPQTFDLPVEDGSYKGDLKVKVLYKLTDIKDVYTSVQKAPIGTPKDGGLLVVIIHGAIIYRQTFSPSTFVSLLFNGESRNTVTQLNTDYPMWLQEFTFMLEQPPTNEYLHLEVINNSWMGLIPGKGSFGCVDISLADVVNGKWINRAYELDRPRHTSYEGPYWHTIYVELHWRTSN